MKKLYRLIFFLAPFSLLFPVSGYSSHIVGGSLTYAYGGANTYTITLKLYRDCDGAVDFSPTALIQVQQADGSEFSPSRDITLPTISTSTVAAVPPPCSTPPATPPCVAERIYRLVVTLAPSPGGMHLFHQVCCRNASIDNISTPSSEGESFYAFIPCYNSSWVEDFTLANGTTSDAGATAWTRTLGTTPPISAQVNNGQFEVSGANGVNIWLEDFPVNGVTSDAGPTAWTRTVTAGAVGVTVANQFQAQGANAGTVTFATQTVSIAAYPQGVNLSVDLSDGGTMEATDVITVSYSIDGAAPVQFPINGSIADDFPASPIIAEATGIIGNNVQIIVNITYSATSPSSEIYNIDNVLIYSPASVVWTSQVIGIAAYASGVNLSTNLSEASTLEPSDNIILSYSLDGGAPVVFPTNGSMFDDFTSVFATASGLIGTTIQIFATVRYGAVSAGEIYDIDMVSVYDNTFLVNNNPVFNLVPPLYFCQTYPDNIDYSATDADGDVLVYSFFTPYENASPCCGPYPAPTYSNNTASFSTVTWLAGYSATSPLNSGGPALSIDAAGQVSGVANTLGNYVFGVKVQEYRGGILLGETTRGYQVEVIVCAPFVPPAPTAGTDNPSPICEGQTLSLTASTVVGATGYTWAGPNSFTSTLQNPTIAGVTTAASGTYSVAATVAGCTGLTGTVSITVNPNPATPVAGSNSTVCSGQTLSLTSNTVAGSTYNWNGPNSFTSTLEDPTIAAVTTAAAGTYTVTRTSAVGCVSTATTTIVAINQTPAAPAAGSNTPVCVGLTLSLTSNTFAGATYNWSGPNSFTSTLEDPTIGAVTTAASGTYSVFVTVGGCVGPVGTTSVSITTIPAAPTAGSNTPICAGQTLSLTANTIASATYNWTGPNSFTSTLEDPTIAAATTAASGTYSVTVSVGGCTGPAGTTSVTVNPIPATPTASSSSPVCSGQTLSLSASAIGGATYSWNGPNSFTSAAQNPTIPAITTAGNGTYSVTATVAGCTGAAGTTSVVVNQTPAAPIAGSNSTVCSGQTLSLTATSTGTTYSWNGPNSFTSTLEDPTIAAVTTAASGTYSVTATTAGCTSTAGTTSVTINQTPAAPVAGSNSTVCSGQTLSLTATSTGTTYSWNGPNSFTSTLEDPTIAAVTTAASGTYSVTATTAGCTGPAGTTSVTINQTPSAPAAGSNSPVCAGTTLSLTASTIAGATYSWNGPSGFSSATQNPTIGGVTTSFSGTYSVTATVAGCTSSTATTSVTVNPIPGAPTPGSNTPVCSGQTLSLTSNTIASATYSWTGPNSFTSTLEDPTIAAVTTAATGTYSVNVTVAGCTSSTATTSVTINATPAAPIPGSNSPLCTGYNLSLTANTVGGATYNWSGPNSFTSTVEDPVIAAITTAGAGTYSVSVTVAGCTGSTATTSVTVNIGPASPVAGSNTPVCSGNTLSLTATTIGGVTYNWNGPNSFTSTLEDPTISSVTTAASGTYSVTATSIANGCVSTPVSTTIVTINQTPSSASIGSNSPACLGGDLSLTASTIGGATYSWSGPNSFTSTLEDPVISGVTAAAAGTYSLTITVAGCTSPLSTTSVVVNAAPPAPIPGSNSPVCTGQTLSLTTATVPAGGYNWSGPNSFTSSLEDPTIGGVTVAAAGTYSLFVTVPGCASSATGTVSVTVNVTPSAPIPLGSNTPICAGQDLSLTSNTVGGATYNWSGPNSFTSSLKDPVITSATSAAAGTYSVSVTVTGCTSPVATTTVTVNPIPAAPIAGSNSPICSGTTLSLTANTIGGATYSWNGPNSFTSASEDPTIPAATTAATGTYSVTVTVLGCTGPAGTVSVTVTDPQTTVPGSNTPVCVGQTLSLTATTVAGATYSWTGPNSFTSTLEDPTIASVPLAAGGTYSVSITVAGCAGPITTTAVTVNPLPASPALGSNSPVCIGSDLSLTATTIAGTTYLWNGPNSFTSTLEDPTISAVTTAEAGTYSLNVTSVATGCVSNTATVSVIINPPPASPTLGSNSPVCSGNTLSLTATTLVGATYSWSGPNSFTSTLEDPTIGGVTTAATGTYSMTATVSGCPPLATETITVTINQTPSAPAAGSNSPVCAGNDISLTASAAGATYNWTGPNSFTSTLQNPVISAATTAMSGTYSVTATSVDGCTGPAGTTSVTVNPIPAAPVAGNNSPICEGQTLSLTANTIASATYNWAGPNSFTSTLEDPTIAGTTTADAGTYTVNITVSGCTGPDAITTVTINATPSAPIAGSNSPICSGQTLSLTASTIGGATYSWNGPLSFTSTSQNPSIAAATTARSGTYSVTATVGGCTGPAGIISVTVNPTPSVVAGSNSPVCEGNTLSLTATTLAGGTYSWNGPNSFTSTLEDPTIPGVTTAAGGTYTVNVTSAAGCVSPNTMVTVTITPTILVAAGADQTVCANNANVSISGTVSGGTTTGIWTSSGTGGFIPSATSLSTNYIPSAADTTAGTVTLTLTSTNNGGCAPMSDVLIVTITDAPIANAGTDQTVCANNATVTLSGSVNSAATGGSWTSSGTGIFSPDNISLSTSYIPSTADTAAGSLSIVLTTTGVGLCSPTTDTMIVTITNAPLVNAGTDISVCVNNPNAALSGSSSTGSGIWVSLGDPGGTFTPAATILTATFVPTAADIAGGSVILVLTSTGNGICNPEDDSVTVFYTPQPTVSAGSDVTVCANNATVTLSGTSSTGTGIWSTAGDGTFTPVATSLTASYIPGSADTAAGSVTLTLTSTGNGGCLPVVDQMTITITDAPTANAGPDQTVCANNAVVTLSGSFTIATGGIWSSSGGGTFAPDNITMGATYTPDAADTLAGSVTIVLTTTGNGLCNGATDTMVITITNTPAVNAGPNTVACKNNPNVPLNGTSSTGSGIWTIVSGTGTFVPTATTLNATYNSSPADTTAGTVILVLTSTGNGNCLAEDDTLIITYIDKPIVNAGPDLTVCTNNPNFAISGTSNTGSGIWTTAGTGTFTPSASLLSTNYSPSAADIASGTITLYFTSTANGTCLPVQDTMIVTISPAPTSNAGVDQTVCANNAVVTLSGSFTISTGAGWTTLGGGTFSPDTFSMIVTYTPSALDTAAGSDTIILTTTGNGNCLAVSDTMIITITDAPVVNAGANQLVCIANPVASLNGSSTTGSGSWSSLGSGTFGNALLLSTTYTASAGDIGAGSVTLVLTSTGNGLCNAVTDTLILTFVSTPTVTAGADQTVCANADTVSLSGTSSTGSGVWSSSGGGIFSPDSISLITTYIPDSADTANGIVTIVLTSTAGCTPITDTMQIIITPAPVVNAGIDQVVCVGTDTAFLSGSVTSGATTGIWSTSGTGTFVPTNTVMNPAYVISSADSAAGGVTIYLTSTGNGNCNAVTDSMNISVVQPPTVNAGPDQTLCSLPVVSLNGTVTGGSGTGVWSTVNGGGTFVPDSTNLTGMYFPSSSDTAFGGVVILVLTSTNNGNCPPSTDTVILTFYPPPVAFAGADIVICKNNADSIPLNGIVQNVFGNLWTTTGGGTFSPSDTILNPYYHPDSTDFTQDTLFIVIQTTPSVCPPAYDTVLVLFSPSPVVNAGSNVLVCEGDTLAVLNGSVSGGAITGQWSTLGSGTFTPNDSTLNATYILSPADTSAGGATLILTSTNNGGCNPETDTVQVIITPAPIVAAGNDTTVCANNDSIFLNGSVTVGSTTGYWSTSGSGIFLPDSSALNATYVPSNADTAAGTVILILTSTNGCIDISDSLVVTITDAPVVNAGANVSVCGGIPVSLNGSVSGGAITGQWTTSGNGTFSPNDSTLNATYIPGSNDTALVTITLTSTGNGQCLAVSDVMTITIGSTPVAGFSVGPICTGSPVLFTDTSTFTNDTIVSWNWTIDGTNDTVQNPNYTYTSSGTDTVILIVTSAIGCTDTAIQIVNINPSPVASYSFITSCSVDSVYFTSTSSISGGTIVSWSWNFGDTNTSTLQNPIHHYDSLGVYVVSLTVTSDSGCTSTFTDTVIPMSGIIAAFADNADCQYNVTFTDTSVIATGDTIISWSWNFGDAGTSTLQNPTHNYSGSGTYIVTLTVTTTGGCTDTISQTITLSPLAIADFSPTSGTYNVGSTITFTDLSTNATSWMWDFGDGGTDIVQHPSHTFEVTGTLDVILVVTNSNGCPDTVKYSFIFNTNIVAVPSAFTPNGDGVNDILFVRGGPLKEMNFRIYNEWGNELFYATDQSEGWDGTYKGKLQPAARYVYILTGTTYGDDEINMQGDVTIIR